MKIKFKIWHKNKEVFLTPCTIDTNGNVIWYDIFNRYELNRDEYVFCSYTGFNDINDQELYYKDIFTLDDKAYVIESSFGMWVFYKDSIWTPLYKVVDKIERNRSYLEDYSLVDYINSYEYK